VTVCATVYEKESVKFDLSLKQNVCLYLIETNQSQIPTTTLSVNLQYQISLK